MGSVLQGACVAGMAFAVWMWNGLQAGIAVLGLLVLFSLSRGLCSVSMKDVQGKCIPKARRGRLAGLATTISGIATVAISVLLITRTGDPSRAFYLSLLLVGAGLWWVAAVLFCFVREYDGETAGGKNARSAGSGRAAGGPSTWQRREPRLTSFRFGVASLDHRLHLGDGRSRHTVTWERRPARRPEV